MACMIVGARDAQGGWPAASWVHGLRGVQRQQHPPRTAARGPRAAHRVLAAERAGAGTARVEQEAGPAGERFGEHGWQVSDDQPEAVRSASGGPAGVSRAVSACLRPAHRVLHLRQRWSCRPGVRPQRVAPPVSRVTPRGGPAPAASSPSITEIMTVRFHVEQDPELGLGKPTPSASTLSMGQGRECPGPGEAPPRSHCPARSDAQMRHVPGCGPRGLTLDPRPRHLTGPRYAHR